MARTPEEEPAPGCRFFMEVGNSQGNQEEESRRGEKEE